MKESPIAYGVDFGTTNSSISIAYPDRVEVLAVESTGVVTCLPSIIYLHRNGDRAAGMDAVEQYLVMGSYGSRCAVCDLGSRKTDCRQHRPGGGCHDARLMSGLKSDLSYPHFESTHSWARDFTLSDLIAIVVQRLKSAADRASAADVKRVVFGHPVAFVGSEGPDFNLRQGLALERLKSAIGLAGFDEVELYPEPAAAVIDEDLEDGVIVSLDFGGGTFDAAVVQLRGGAGEIIALQGAAIGGARFDELLFEDKVSPSLGWDRLPPWLHKELRSLSTFRWLLTDPQAQKTLAETRGEPFRQLERIMFGGFAYGFYQAIERAKIELSSKDNTVIRFFRPGIDIAIPVSRIEFERLIAPDLAVIRETISAALQQAQITPGDVQLVLRTGGSGDIPAFVQSLEETFAPEKLLKRETFSSVVHGLGVRARDLWGE